MTGDTGKNHWLCETCNHHWTEVFEWLGKGGQRWHFREPFLTGCPKCKSEVKQLKFPHTYLAVTEDVYL